MANRREFLDRIVRGSVGAALAAAGLPAVARPVLAGAADDEGFWELVRQQYPLTRERTYLNTGGLGPAPYPVLDVFEKVTMEMQRISEHGHHLIEDARAPVAAFFRGRPEEIAFTRNATEANAIVAAGLKMRAGDEVIFESHAHPGGSFPWLNRQKLDGVRVRLFEPDPNSAAGNLERIERLITPRTRCIQVSHVTAPTGIRFPVEEIARMARARGIWFHVDGAQSAGMFPVDLPATGCDSFATSGHKWMGAPHETGVLFVRQDRLDEVEPRLVGAYSEGEWAFPDRFEYHPTARRYEYGTRSAALVAGLVASVEFLERIGMERVAAHGHGLARYLQGLLREIPGVSVLTPSDPALHGSITTLKTERVPYDRLTAFYGEKYGLRARVVTEENLNAVRVSTHLFNSEADCDRVAEATRAALAEIGNR